METPKLTGERIKNYLAEGKRFDSRNPDEFRNISVETGISNKAEGSAKVKLGKTEVLVGVKMSVAEPYPDSPTKGNLIVSSELLPLSSERFESGPPKIESIEIARIIDRIIRESKYVQMDDLCIKEGEKVWNIFIDIYSINDDGNLLDAAGIGAVVALNNARIPKYDEEEDKVLYGEWTENKIPLADFTPISITVHKLGENLIVDPTREEEDVSEARLTVGSSDGTIHSMQKGNSSALSVEEFEKALEMVEKSWKSLYSELSKHLG